MLHHQKVLGATQTILLPGGRPADSNSTLHGRANGLEAAAGSYEVCMPVAKAHPGEFFFGANDVPDLPGAKERIENQLKSGAVCIGEQKFNLPCDSKEMELVYAIAQEFDVPILMHFQFKTYNTDFERFGNVLKKWPKVNFIGHAQTFWANIDKNHADQSSLYPRGKVTPGGWTDKYLSDFENMWGDMSAGSGLNAMTRDEEHAAAFMERHQDRLLYGSDCSDSAGHGPACSGAQQIACIRRLAPKKIQEKIFFRNTQGLYRLS
jgi:predicted TIM-barrel fold metal-dependent hydrolase